LGPALSYKIVTYVPFTTTDTRETKMKRKGKRRRGDSDDEDLAADD
jgi:hypothetical protein